MKKLATKFREAQIFAHAAHNVIHGSSFFADHDFLGEAYEAYTKAYDETIERIIGLGDEVNPIQITANAGEEATKYNVIRMDGYDMFSELLNLEKEICDLVKETIADGVSHGTSNLLEGFADHSEVRQYKIKQRIL
jgi:DNA-binding ferritin-like protein